MSENSSDSESSCGWTILNHEGSDIETLLSEVGPCPDLALDHSTTLVDNVHPDSADELAGVWSNEVTLSNLENLHSTPEDLQGATELLSSCSSYTNPASSPVHTDHHEKEGAVSEDSHCEAVSDDSDIVTLEPPKVDEVGPLEEEIPEDLSRNEDLNMSFSSSSQYTFSQPEPVFPSQPSEEDSSNDEASDDSGPILRHRRSRKSTISGSESENKTPAEQPAASAPRTLGWMSSSLNKCIILALVIAISMGFGHFYGTIQILERQKYVEKILESELNEMKDDLHQCQREQEVTIKHKQDAVEQFSENREEKQDLVLSLEGLMVKITKENHRLKQKQNELKLEADEIAANLKTTEVQNTNLALENQHLRESLEKEEQALSSLKEELRKLREQIRNLDEKGRHEIIVLENQKLKEHLKEERQKVLAFRTQKESLLNDAQMLRKELDNERRITDSLRVELEEISKRRSSASSFESDHEIEHLKGRLTELEKKLNFEQQRSDLWERLYIETKEQNEKLETGNSHQETDHSEGKSKGKPKKKAKDTFFNSVKDTFDAMKNSTKEFVRHHKEKIKQAKEAVKENLKKFSDSVKNTFRHFKDTTRNIFDKNHNRKHAERRREETKGARTVRRAHKPEAEKMYPNKATAGHREYEGPQDDQNSQYEGTASWKSTSEEKIYPSKKGCSGVYDCAHQESISLFNKVLDPVRVEEFNDLMQVYLQEQVDNFQHWEELEQFINRFFTDGVFIHDQMLFTDFVKNVEDYLEDMKEYQTNTGGVFEDLDEFVYRHYFGNAYSTPYGPRKPERTTPYKNSENKNNRKEEEKHQARYKREGKWNKHGRANGRQMANVEIELGQLPFDPKY